MGLGDTPKFIQKMCDDIEAAEADVRSGDPTLQLCGIATLIAIAREQSTLIHSEVGDYPEGRRMAAFLQKRIDDLETMKSRIESQLQLREEADLCSKRTYSALREADRKAREKIARAEAREVARLRAALRAETKRAEDAQKALDDARQGKLF